MLLNCNPMLHCHMLVMRMHGVHFELALQLKISDVYCYRLPGKI